MGLRHRSNLTYHSIVGYFPEPYPDEIFYSICARFAELMAFPEIEVVRQLFGTSGSIPAVDRPKRLDEFVSRLPPGHKYTSDRIIDDHSLLPYYAPFLPYQRYIQLRERMKGNSRAKIIACAGYANNIFEQLKFLRYCPKCFYEDLELYKVAYWHRKHQIPGVILCSKHKSLLHVSEFRVGGISVRRDIFPASGLGTTKKNEVSKPVTNSLLLTLAQNTTFLFEYHLTENTFENIQSNIVALLDKKGFLLPTGQFRMAKIINKLRSLLAEEIFLGDYVDEIKNLRNDSWIQCTLRHPSMSKNPQAVQILCYLLGHELEEIFLTPNNVAKKYFVGDVEHWPCLNPACEHYLQYVLTQEDIKRISSKTYLFSCKCGFQYRRTGLYIPDDDIWCRKYRIVTFGAVWDQKFKELWLSPNISMDEIATSLRIGDTNIYNRAAELHLPYPRPGKKAVLETIPSYKKPKKCNRVKFTKPKPNPKPKRKEWLQIVRKFPSLGRLELSRKFYRIYLWLYRNDRDWFVAHLPPKNIKSTNSLKETLKFDLMISSEVIKCAKTIKDRPGRPVWITPWRIGNRIGQHPLFRKINKMQNKYPRIYTALQEVCESWEGYVKRKIQWGLDHFFTINEKPGKRRFLEKASLTHHANNPFVNELVDKALDRLNGTDIQDS